MTKQTTILTFGIAALLALDRPAAATSNTAVFLPTSQTGSTRLFLGVPARQEPVRVRPSTAPNDTKCVIASTGANTITLTAAGALDATSEAAIESGLPFTVYFMTGEHYGKSVALVSGGTAYNSGTLTLSVTTVIGALPSGLDAGTEIEIVPAPTLNRMFGSANSAGFAAGDYGSLATTDILNILGTGLGAGQYYYDAGLGNEGWRETGGAQDLKGDERLPESIGFFVQTGTRGAPISVDIKGIAKSSAINIVIESGFRVYSWPFAQAVSLKESGLQSTLAPGDFGALGSTDLVSVWEGGVLVEYYFDNGAGVGYWCRSDDPAGVSYDNVLLEAGEGFAINRNGTATNHRAKELFPAQ